MIDKIVKATIALLLSYVAVNIATEGEPEPVVVTNTEVVEVGAPPDQYNLQDLQKPVPPPAKVECSTGTCAPTYGRVYQYAPAPRRGIFGRIFRR
jgi:hypothetical protein